MKKLIKKIESKYEELTNKLDNQMILSEKEYYAIQKHADNLYSILSDLQLLGYKNNTTFQQSNLHNEKEIGQIDDYVIYESGPLLIFKINGKGKSTIIHTKRLLDIGKTKLLTENLQYHFLVKRKDEKSSIVSILIYKNSEKKFDDFLLRKFNISLEFVYFCYVQPNLRKLPRINKKERLEYS